MDFYNLLRVFLLLIAFVKSITVSLGVFTSSLIFLLFFECFDFTNFLYHDCFLPVSSFLCCCTVSVTDWRELILLSGILYLTLLPNIWHHLLWSRLPQEPALLPWRLQDLPLRFKTQAQPISLSESHSVQQKVVLGRFYLDIKVLQNSVSTSSRLWNHFLIATYIARCMSYLLSYKRS